MVFMIVFMAWNLRRILSLQYLPTNPFPIFDIISWIQKNSQYYPISLAFQG